MWNRYGLTMQQFQALNTTRSSDIIALTRVPRAPSVLWEGAPAKAGSRGSSRGPAAAKAKATRLLRVHAAAAPLPGAPPPQVPVTDGVIAKLNKRARARGYLSHTDLFQQEAEHRASCAANGYPEWLRWTDGTYALVDGSDNRV